MKRIVPILMTSIGLLSLFLGGCSKDNDDGEGSGMGVLPGHIYHQYTSDVMKIDMRNGEESAFFSYNAYSTVGWGLSRDGSLRIVSTREPGMYDRNRFTIVNTGDETIVNEFDFVPRYGNNTNNLGKISYDNSLVMVPPDRDNGIVILDIDGNVKYEMSGIGGESFTSEDDAVWLPNNSLLIRFKDRLLLRSDPPYTSLNLVKEMNYENWGNIRVSNSGQKITFYINKHIHMMDITGENLVQVTDSNTDEAFAEFSPDDKYLLIAADYVHLPASQNSHWFLKIIPADGKKYNLDSSPEVIPVIPKGSSSIIRANGVTAWR